MHVKKRQRHLFGVPLPKKQGVLHYFCAFLSLFPNGTEDDDKEEDADDGCDAGTRGATQEMNRAILIR